MTSLDPLSRLTVNVDGSNYVANPEYTSQAVANDYQTALAPFVNLINVAGGPNATAATIASAITSGNYAAQFQAALYGGTVTANGASVQVSGLLNLLNLGIKDPKTGVTNYMTVEMANALDQLLRIVNAAGIQLNDSPIGTPQVENFANLAVSSGVIANVLQTAINTATIDNTSLQSFTELVYVNTGNNILSTQLVALETALSATSNSLNILNSLQTLHNNLTITPRVTFNSAFPGLFAEGAGQFLTDFTKDVQSFSQPISPTLLTPIKSSQLIQFQSLINQLRLNISALANPNVTSGGQTGTENPQSLLGTMRVVYNDLLHAISTTPTSIRTSSHFSTNTAGTKVFINSVTTALSTAAIFEIAMSRWTLDSYSTVPTAGSLGAAGNIQNDLTTAITAGQSLNDTQKENVRNYLYVFEEYYKSASTILNQITQIITKMAEGISR